jgi:hypothetical protein
MMQSIEDAKPRLPRRIQDLEHVRKTTNRFRDRLQAIPDLAALGNEIVVRIDHQKCSALPVMCHLHDGSEYSRRELCRGSELAAALRRAAPANAEYENRIGRHDATGWPDWYAEYVVREHAGGRTQWRNVSAAQPSLSAIGVIAAHWGRVLGLVLPDHSDRAPAVPGKTR